MQFTELFLEEHGLIRRAVGVLSTMTDRAETGISADRHDVNALLIFLHYFVDLCHQVKEESVLFPALRQCQMTQYSQVAIPLLGQLQHLLREHIEDRALIEKSQVALFSEKPAEFAENGRALALLLLEHAHFEEETLFPTAEEILGQAEINILTNRMEEADAEFGASQKSLLIAMLAELERKYLAKAA
jgi:hemerythrin-like domain-containing protein